MPCGDMVHHTLQGLPHGATGAIGAQAAVLPSEAAIDASGSSAASAGSSFKQDLEQLRDLVLSEMRGRSDGEQALHAELSRQEAMSQQLGFRIQEVLDEVREELPKMQKQLRELLASELGRARGALAAAAAAEVRELLMGSGGAPSVGGIATAGGCASGGGTPRGGIAPSMGSKGGDEGAAISSPKACNGLTPKGHASPTICSDTSSAATPRCALELLPAAASGEVAVAAAAHAAAAVAASQLRMQTPPCLSAREAEDVQEFVDRVAEAHFQEARIEFTNQISDLERRITEEWTGLRGWVDAAVVAVVNRISSLECSLQSEIAERTGREEETQEEVAKAVDLVRRLQADVDELALEVGGRNTSANELLTMAAAAVAATTDAECLDVSGTAAPTTPPTMSNAVARSQPPPPTAIAASPTGGQSVSPRGSLTLPRAQSYGGALPSSTSSRHPTPSNRSAGNPAATKPQPLGNCQQTPTVQQPSGRNIAGGSGALPPGGASGVTSSASASMDALSRSRSTVPPAHLCAPMVSPTVTVAAAAAGGSAASAAVAHTVVPTGAMSHGYGCTMMPQAGGSRGPSPTRSYPNSPMMSTGRVVHLRRG